MRAGKGFGELLQRKRKGGAEEKLKESLGCPCGGGDERREYSDCCARYHGGVVEPDALTLMSMSLTLISMNVNVIATSLSPIHSKMYR